jgi:hypothetical protein
VQGFFTFSAEPTEDLGLEDADNEGSEDESPLAPAPGGEHTLSSSSDDEGEDTSDEEMEELSEQNPDSECSEEEDDDGVYLTANAYEGGHITVNVATFTAFATKLRIKKFPVP